MIAHAAEFIQGEVARYLLQHGLLANEKEMQLGNIAAAENMATLRDTLVMTLVNIEEESTLKNNRHLVRNPMNQTLEQGNPPIHLNLYFLFTATTSDSDLNVDDNYLKALSRISKVIELFQAKKVFTFQNSPGAVQPEPGLFLRLLPELYTLTFEQINHLWGSLGGKQSPCVLYKFRLIAIQSGNFTEAPVIDTIQTDAAPTNAERPI